MVVELDSINSFFGIHLVGLFYWLSASSSCFWHSFGRTVLLDKFELKHESTGLNEKAASELIRSSVEPILEQYRPAIIDSLKFRKLIFGIVAPQFTGVGDM